MLNSNSLVALRNFGSKCHVTVPVVPNFSSRNLKPVHAKLLLHTIMTGQRLFQTRRMKKAGTYYIELALMCTKLAIDSSYLQYNINFDSVIIRRSLYDLDGRSKDSNNLERGFYGRPEVF